ncbi:MAG: 23S rRNA (adenine(2503)-C(2))-methyltransferase RlmN [Edaphobacter sp.]|uniref:23S rRNA (adenine(2503)-C(2))-methyltransferase RlmN n=1 Tax=Edaphobacter sp. TaxID=1934404 RepID=UPI0023887E3B|nr:23S rRNA (adenine(2503)-C(2))-methyltransferase RlmN [Edaphobacter sp.]MDE1178425.1 23S rRNA (adenine(2503)-C(2))-methyltransferase RlmN [Edaphobacter sp.]
MLPEELKALMESHGQKGYRAKQIEEALYRQRVSSLDEVTVLPSTLRETLAGDGYSLGLPELVQTAKSVDGTERYLVRLADGETVETVWMPDGDGGERGDGSEASAEEEAEEGLEGNASEFGPAAPFEAAASLEAAPKRDLRNVGALEQNGYRRATICISSQVGCAVNCQFCLTAKLGIRRNLTGGEIAGQVAAVLNRHGVKIGKDRINLVFMGMGEPFLNYDEFIRSVQILTKHIGIPESRMTVSTSGIEPAIRRFAQEPVRPKLALSLNASNDVIREQVMPITRKWKIAQLLDAVKTLPLGKREWVTFEYVMLGGINDQPEHAREVLELLKDIRSKVNLIVWNPGPGIDYTQPKPEDVAAFQKMLIEAGMPAYIRRPRGRDIYAACGQLKRTVDSPGATPAAALVEIAPAASLPS